MARQLRVEYPGAIYHVMNRGDRREAIFHDDRDREQFLTTLSEACVKTGWQVHALCLMPNHFHLVIETPQANLATELHQRRLSVVTLQRRPKGDPVKVVIAGRLRRETTMTAAWIADRLGMGSTHYARCLLYLTRHGERSESVFANR